MTEKNREQLTEELREVLRGKLDLKKDEAWLTIESETGSDAEFVEVLVNVFANGYSDKSFMQGQADARSMVRKEFGDNFEIMTRITKLFQEIVNEFKDGLEGSEEVKRETRSSGIRN